MFLKQFLLTFTFLSVFSKQFISDEKNYVSRKKLFHRFYQEECVTTRNGSFGVGYASADHNTYLECYPTPQREPSEGGLNHDQLEESKTCETGSEHYLSVNPRPPTNTYDVWKTIKETVEKNRERNSMLQLLSRKSVPPNACQRYSYLSVVEEQAVTRENDC